MFKFSIFKNSFIKNSFQISNFKFQIAILALVAILLFANTTAVQAQVISLSLWPPLLEVQIMPGKTIIQAYQLANNSDSFLEVTPRIFPFAPQGEKGEINISSKFKVQNSKLDFFSFASGEQFDRPFSLKPQETKQIVLKIGLPKDTPEKDYYFTLLFSTAVKNEIKEKSKTDSITQIGANILLTSSNEEKPPLLGRIKNFSAPKIIDSFSAVEFTVVLENFGKTFWKPFGKIEVVGILKQNDEIKLLEQNILETSSRKLDIGKYKPSLPIGPFKARLEFSLNEESAEPKLSKEIVFWYLPYRLIIVITIIIFINIVLRRGLALFGIARPRLKN